MRNSRVLGSVALVPGNWVFQGMRYMNGYELAFKLLLDGALTVALATPPLIADPVPRWTAAFLAAHTINWLINGHIFVLARYFHAVRRDTKDFHQYVESLRERGHARKYLEAVAIYGSYARDALTGTSDLDVRFIVARGWKSAVAGTFYCFLERFRAFLRLFPLDIYCSVELDGLRKLSSDESPVILFDRPGYFSGSREDRTGPFTSRES